MSAQTTTHVSLSDALFDALPVASLVHDEHTILASNVASRTILDAKPGELEGLAVTEIVHPDGRDAGTVRRELLLHHGQRFEGLPVKLLTRSGAAVTATGTGVTFTHGARPVAIVAACRDASCVGTASGVIVPPPVYPADTPLLDAVVDSFPLPIFAVREFEIAYVNRAAIAMLRARTAEDLIGRPHSDVVHPDSITRVAEQIYLTLERGVTLEVGGVKGTSLDGAPFETHGRSARAEFAGEVFGLFVVTHTSRADV